MKAMFRALPTGAKLLIILTLALLPLGLAMAWNASRGMAEAREGAISAANDDALLAVRALDAVIARNILALRIAAKAADGKADACGAIEQALANAPGVARQIRFLSATPGRSCGAAGMADSVASDLVRPGGNALLRPGAIALGLARGGIEIRVGVNGGTAIEIIDSDELQSIAAAAVDGIDRLALSDGRTELTVLAPAASVGALAHERRLAIGNGRLSARVEQQLPEVALADQLDLLLPILMWLVAALVSWLLVHNLLTGPLKRLEQAVRQYEPGEGAFDLPDKVGVAGELRSLGLAFARTIDRIDAAEQEMAQALDGQRRLVREVHHRVKNNLQVVASLLSIHSRTASTPEARAAYAGIMRRVDALSVVHRNHFAEAEENRGIALRPLLSELAAGLRAGAPDPAKRMVIELDLQQANTTQDVAVAVAFLVTEIVEFTMLGCPGAAVEISLRRSGELTSELAIASECLVVSGDAAQDPERAMFERIVDGLARQLRTPLDRRLGRYSVTLPIFPD